MPPYLPARAARLRWPVALLAPLLVAGCLAEPAPAAAGDDWRLMGAFTREATPAQVDEAVALVRERGGEMVILESFPLQFVASGLAEGACAEVRALLAAKAYVARAGECFLPDPTLDPEKTASSADPPPGG